MILVSLVGSVRSVAKESSASFPGSSLCREKDLGWVWSRGTHIQVANKLISVSILPMVWRKRFYFHHDKQTCTFFLFVP